MTTEDFNFYNDYDKKTPSLTDEVKEAGFGDKTVGDMTPDDAANLLESHRQMRAENASQNKDLGYDETKEIFDRGQTSGPVNFIKMAELKNDNEDNNVAQTIHDISTEARGARRLNAPSEVMMENANWRSKRDFGPYAEKVRDIAKKAGVIALAVGVAALIFAYITFANKKHDESLANSKPLTNQEMQDAAKDFYDKNENEYNPGGP